MKSLFDVCAPAKLNLFLHIVGRRPDGYHLLESVFVLIDWCDTLHFERRGQGLLSREDLSTPLPVDDLVMRAARVLQKHTGTRQGVHISVEKRVPAQAGMGGGSSDAASTLLALNRLWGLHLDLDSLCAIGLTLGADVPFFLGGQSAFVTGIGEKLAPISVPQSRYLVVKPPDGLETQRIFSHPLLKRDSEPTIISGFATAAEGFGCNDLQDIAQQFCPGVGLAIDWLDSLGLSGRMTGSGSAVFSKLAHDIDISNAPESFEVKICNGLPVHPLFGWAV